MEKIDFFWNFLIFFEHFCQTIQKWNLRFLVKKVKILKKYFFENFFFQNISEIFFQNKISPWNFNIFGQVFFFATIWMATFVSARLYGLFCLGRDGAKEMCPDPIVPAPARCHQPKQEAIDPNGRSGLTGSKSLDFLRKYKYVCVLPNVFGSRSWCSA